MMAEKASDLASSKGKKKCSFFYNWDSPRARLNSHYEAWSYKKKNHKKTVEIDILITFRNGDNKIMEFIRITQRSPSRKRKLNQLRQF